MITELRRAVLFTFVTMLLFGGIYPLAVWGIGRVAFPGQAQGSLITRADGSIAGSSLIAQKFTAPRYFHPRPSAVDYNAASTGGSNLGASNPDQLKAIADRIAAVTSEDGVAAEAVPAEMITASGAGLDPHIPPAAAELQINRIATARGVPADRIGEILRLHVEPPVLGIFGRPRVNVLELNLALDRVLAQ